MRAYSPIALLIPLKINTQGVPSLYNLFTRAYPTVDIQDYRKLFNLGIELVYSSGYLYRAPSCNSLLS